jgi:hypothetical protein
VKYDLNTSTGYEDGWIIVIKTTNTPATSKWYHYRETARFDRHEYGPAAKHLRIVKARRILAWKKP